MAGSEDEYDEEYDEEEELYESEDEEDVNAATGSRNVSSRVATMEPEAQEWVGLKSFPTSVQSVLFDQLSKLRDQKKRELTILLVGKNGVGKSSTCNSIMGEKVFAASAFQAPQTGEPQMVSRQASGFTLRVIETPGLLDGDTVHEEHLNALGEFVADKTIDAVLYVDRLDTYRLQTMDKQIMEALTTRFGPHVWDITTFVLTHGNVPPPSGLSYEQFVQRRHDILKAAVRKVAPESTAEVPLAVVENGSRCKVNAEGAKILPDGSVWLTSLMGVLVKLVSANEKLDTSAAMGDGADVYAQKRRWLMWPLLAVQLLVIKPLVSWQIARDVDYN